MAVATKQTAAHKTQLGTKYCLSLIKSFIIHDITQHNDHKDIMTKARNSLPGIQYISNKSTLNHENIFLSYKSFEEEKIAGFKA